MSRIAEMFHRLRYLATRRGSDREIEEEMRLHVEARAEELAREGLAEAAALAQARREFGSCARAQEDSRSAWQLAWIEDLLADAGYAARSFRRDPGFALTAVACLALGIGVNTLVFSVASEVLFSTPSVRDPQTLVHVRLGGNSHMPLREYGFVRNSGVFSGLGGENENMEVNWRHGEVSERLFGMRVTGNFFQVAGIPLALGRPLAPGETTSVVISYRLWQGRFAGDPQIIGSKMVLDGAPFTVAGVLPRDHRTVIGYGFSPDLYAPLADEHDPNAFVALYGRARSGMSRSELLARLRAVGEDLDRTYPDPNVRWSREISAAPLAGIDRLRGEKEGPALAFAFVVLMAVVGLVLLIACANVASLLLARAASRSHEFSIRLSIGAGSGRIVRQLLAESLLLALCGAAAGLALNLVGSSAVSRIQLPLPLPIQFLIEPDWGLIAYSIAATMACALAAGLAPALSAARSTLASTLKLDSRQTGAGQSRLRNALVVAQLAASVVLLAAGFICLRNLLQASSMSPGFDANRTDWASMRLVPEAYPKVARVNALAATALEKLRALPGVESAAVARVVPLNDNMHTSTELTAEGVAEAKRVQFHYNFVGGDYFRTLGIRILAGREFLRSDRDAAILNRNLARALFGNVDPVGHMIRFHEGRRLQVVGVAADSKYFTLGDVNPMALYEPYGNSDRSVENLHFLVRTPLDPASLVPAIDRALAALDSTAAIETKPMSRALVFAMLPSRVGAALLGSIGLLGLALASIGLYGTLAYAVSRRIREIGLRVALGATPGKVLRLVAWQSGVLVAAGLTAGLSLAVFIVRPLAIFLIPEIRPDDPANFAVVAGILGLVALAATVAPAIRALRVAPAIALRHE